MTADVVPGAANANKVLNDIEELAMPALCAAYPGFTYTYEGQWRVQIESLGALLTGLSLALVAIFALLAIPFGSYVQPVIVMAAIPFERPCATREAPQQKTPCIQGSRAVGLFVRI